MSITDYKDLAGKLLRQDHGTIFQLADGCDAYGLSVLCKGIYDDVNASPRKDLFLEIRGKSCGKHCGKGEFSATCGTLYYIGMGELSRVYGGGEIALQSIVSQKRTEDLFRDGILCHLVLLLSPAAVLKPYYRSAVRIFRL